MPPEMQRTYIATPDPHSLFYRQLRRELIAAGVDIVDSETDATAVFTVYYDDTEQRVLSVSARNVPTEYEVYYTVEYGLVSGNAVLLPTQDLTLTRDYTYDPTLVLGKAREEQSLREAIARDLVRIVVKQISTQ
ncbi:MAG: LPS assembly lipoprotein LptE [Woeseiaceae bacterium]|nr:LPS assembly lipoprotein LptE [Woeseiaceae bacterium]